MKASAFTRTTALLSLAALLLVYNLACAQNQPLIDSLKKIIEKQPPAKQFDILCAIGFEYRISIQDSTIKYCNLALELGKKIHLKVGLGKPLNFIGLAHTNKGDYKKAFDYYYQAIEVASEQNDSLQLAHSYNNLGRAFYDLGDLSRAYDNFLVSKNIFEKINDKGGLAYVYRSLANVYKSQNNMSEAIEMSSRALELRKQLKDKRTLASAYAELGLLYQGMKDFNMSLQKLKVADSIALQVNDKLSRAEIKLGIAENLFELKQYDSAYQIATRILSLIQNGKNYKIFLRSSMLCARYHIQKNNSTRALSILNEIESDTSGFGLASFQRDAAFLLIQIYAQKKDQANFEKYSNHFELFNQKLQTTDLQRQVDQLKFNSELETKEKENVLLKFDQEQSRILITKQRNENVLLLLLSILIGISALVTWIFNRKRKRDNFKLEIQNQEIVRQREEIKKQIENLSKANHELSELNHEKNMLMSIVAHDLKSPINRIYALARIIEMEGELNESQLNYLRLIKETTNSGISLITDLLDVTALEEANQKLTTSEIDIQELIKSKIELLKLTASGKDIKISVQNEVHQKIVTDADYLSRVLDNLTSNAIKFSHRATHIFIKLSLNESNLVLSVRDEGPGFSESDKRNLYQKFRKLTARPTAGESSNGLGLAIVKTLIDRLKGSIELRSQYGSGSEFIVKIPI